MRFWTREVGGWVLVGLGLLVFYRVFLLLTRQPTPGYLESGPLIVIGVFVFRGGIHLLKVAVAARVCEETLPGPERGRTSAGAGARLARPLPGMTGARGSEARS